MYSVLQTNLCSLCVEVIAQHQLHSRSCTQAYATLLRAWCCQGFSFRGGPPPEVGSCVALYNVCQSLCWFTTVCRYVDYWPFIIGSRKGCIPYSGKICVISWANRISLKVLLWIGSLLPSWVLPMLYMQNHTEKTKWKLQKWAMPGGWGIPPSGGMRSRLMRLLKSIIPRHLECRRNKFLLLCIKS